MSIAIVWFRRDLRVHDHPALAAAAREHEHVVPAFLLDDALLAISPGRTAFLLACLRELDAALRERGAGLVVRRGDVVALAAEVLAGAVYWASDVSPYARARDDRVAARLREAGIEPRPQPGNFVADIGKLRTKAGTPFTVFTPFWKAWLNAPRRAVEDAPGALALPGGLDRGALPDTEHALPEEDPPGERAGRERMLAWARGGVDGYDRTHDRLAGGSSRLSPYLHFGCVSARELEQRVRDGGEGRPRGSFVRQVCWRDFYAHVLLYHPDNARVAYQERYRALEWDDDDALLACWKEGRTGYPLVDAAMRQLRASGWMHNRARLVVGSFLTKDLQQDWRAGEAHFMAHLLDGDEASNNGNWQWIASVGVDPQPYFRRIYNPTLQQERFDPDGVYVRRWVPELRDVPLERLAEPWTMSAAEQEAAGCVIGRDYPEPVVDHQAARRRAMERYRAAGGES